MDAMPKYIYNSITEITPEELRRIGAVAVGIDLDNTTVYDSTLRPREGVLPWIRKVKAAGIPIIIISIVVITMGSKESFGTSRLRYQNRRYS